MGIWQKCVVLRLSLIHICGEKGLGSFSWMGSSFFRINFRKTHCTMIIGMLASSILVGIDDS